MLDTYIYSVYIPPSASQEEFEAILDSLAEHIQGQHPVIIAGDFNAWAMEWGSRITNSRGEILLDVFASLDLVLLNSGLTPTYMSNNGNSSFIDLTFTNEALVPRITSWQVSDTFTNSDHQAIIFEIGFPERGHRVSACQRGWNAKSFGREIFIVMMKEELVLTGLPDAKASQLMSLIVNACAASVTRRSISNRHSPVY